MTMTPQCPDPRVWVDDRHQIFRRGVISCLVDDGLTVAGESSGLDPAPDPASSTSWSSASSATPPIASCRVVTDDPAGRPRSSARAPTRLICRIVEQGVTAMLLPRRAEPRAAASVDPGRPRRAPSTMPTELLPRLLERAATGGASSTRALSEREISGAAPAGRRRGHPATSARPSATPNAP